MSSLGVQITKRIKESRERTAIQAGKLLLHICIPLMNRRSFVIGGEGRAQQDQLDQKYRIPGTYNWYQLLM